MLIFVQIFLFLAVFVGLVCLVFAYDKTAVSNIKKIFYFLK